MKKGKKAKERKRKKWIRKESRQEKGTEKKDKDDEGK